jgi:hypothetical protein
LIGTLILIFIFIGIPILKAQQQGFPRIGIFHWGGATPEWYAKFNLLITKPKKPSKMIKKIKSINPNIIILPTVDWNAGADIKPLPEEWIVRDSQGKKINLYGPNTFLVDITDFCKKSTKNDKTYNKKFNEYLSEWMANLVNLKIWDGVATDGVWDHPYGKKDVDLDRNGNNDLEEHGKAWLRKKWLAGVHKVVVDIRKKIGNNKIIHLNSGRFHDFEWKTTNGITLENMGQSSSFKNLKKNYDRWLKTAPDPHSFLIDGKGNSKNNFPWMRFLLGMALYGDGYYGYAESDQHNYDRYYDEFDVDLGYPAGPMWKLKSLGGNELGIWIRFFDNGAAIVNISGNEITVTNDEIQSHDGYDGSYYRFQGGQDPDFNNGQLFDQVTLQGYWNKKKATYIGDAIILVKNQQTVISEIIIDNVDIGTSPASEAAQLVPKNKWNSYGNKNNSWTLSCKPGKGYFTHSETKKGDGKTQAVFRPTIGVPGNYEIFEWHGHTVNEKKATNVPYVITYNNGQKSEGLIDQSKNQGRWNSLGIYEFAKGSNGAVTISNKADGYVIADAFKFVYHEGDIDKTPPSKPIKLSN